MEKIFYAVIAVGVVLLFAVEILRISMTSRFDRIEGKLEMLRSTKSAGIEPTQPILVNRDKSREFQNG